jgi:hypothetical protein
MRQDMLAMGGQVQLLYGPVQAVINEAAGEVQQEIAAHALANGFDIQAVVEDAFQDGLADAVVVSRLGQHALGAGTEGATAAAPGSIFAVGDLKVGNLLVGNGAHVAVQNALAAGQLAAMRAGSLLAGTVYGDINDVGCYGIHACVLP